jgi:Tol biopolymer transport system component
VRHCLEKDPESRFQSARDLGFALETLSNFSETRTARPWRSKSSAKVLAWALAGMLTFAIFLLAANLIRHNGLPSITYRRLTFKEGTLYSARFTPDFHSVVYGAAWNNKPLQLFSSVGESLQTQELNISDASLLAISKSGELALSLHGAHITHLVIEKGTLARAPLAGGSPREILEDVPWADWGPNGELAVVHHVDGRDQIEYPIGHVLHRSNSWISHIRVSPHGDKIAFIDHPVLWDDRGSVAVVDNTGRVQTLSPDYGSTEGEAWSPDGKEVWFTAAVSGYTRSLLAVNAAGKVRTILDIPAGLTLQDMAPDGRVLVSLDAERLAMATCARGGKATDISWHDWDVAKDISRDGQSVLFEDASEAAGPNYSVAIRKIDGSPPVQLGEGSAGGLSPDGKWAISILTGTPGRVTLLPVGPGQPRVIPVTGLERIDNGNSRFLADGKRITVNGNEPGHGVRCYLVNLDGGKPIPITPEGVTGGLVSSDGQYIVANNGPTAAVYPVGGGSPRPIPGLEEGFIPEQWSEDNTALYGFRPGSTPTQVFKIKLATGEKTLIQNLQPETTAGLVSIHPVAVTHDGSRFAYSYYQVFSVLYVISGLQ